MKQTIILLALLSLTAACSTNSMNTADGDAAPAAVAELKPTQGNMTSGAVMFAQKDGKVQVEANITGLTPGVHGFHIHEKGDCSAPDATSAGGHFNPANQPHGGPMDEMHHGGDLGNLIAGADGKATLKMAAGGISLENGKANNIIGRAVIVHADPDDLKSQPVGNAGKRVACAVIVAK